MVADYNHLAAKAFCECLRSGDRQGALDFAKIVSRDPDAGIYGASLENEYNDEELADLIEPHLKGIDQGRWDMTSKIHLPAVIGAVCHWIAAESHRLSDGKTGSESLEQGQDGDSTGP